MHYYKATIQYEGTNYAGFQWQNGLQTIQNDFNQVLSKILSGKVTTRGASRTDTGVHALEQIVKISSENPLDLASFVKTINTLLPAQIRCLDIASCPGDFHPSVEAVSKEYRYLFTNKTKLKERERQFIANIANPLDLDLMKDCIELLRGKHDFFHFCSSGSNVKSTVREITFCELSEINPHDVLGPSELFNLSEGQNSCYQLKIEANGFLKQMIRHIVSALWMVGSGKLSKEAFRDLLQKPTKKNQIWKVAPANGLFLYKINYGGKDRGSLSQRPST